MHLLRLYHTVRHLKARQVWYRLWHKVKRRLYIEKAFFEYNYAIFEKRLCSVKLFRYPHYHSALYNDGKTFTLLNLTYTFNGPIDWNFTGNGRLWTFELNYFSWLQDDTLTADVRRTTIRSYTLQQRTLVDGRHSYTISERIFNWIQFFISEQEYNPEALKLLHAHTKRLAAFPEYAISANHLLLNGLALLFAGLFFEDTDLVKLASQIIEKELAEQILPDGAHYERSAAYHSSLLRRMLQCIELASQTSPCEAITLMKAKASIMLGWLKAYAFSNHSYAAFGDGDFAHAPGYEDLKLHAAVLGISPATVKLRESHYRKLNTGTFELLINAGQASPAHQPGHSHADALSICLQYNSQPFICDTGVSTYELNDIRLTERSTAAHNTITISDKNSTDVWHRFRAGRRANMHIIKDVPTEIIAAHDGYKAEFNIKHQRQITAREGTITITDTLAGWRGQKAALRWHFAPGVNLIKNKEGEYRSGDITVRVSGAESISLQPFDKSEGFNRRCEGICMVAIVGNQTITTITSIPDAD